MHLQLLYLCWLVSELCMHDSEMNNPKVLIFCFTTIRKCIIVFVKSLQPPPASPNLRSLETNFQFAIQIRFRVKTRHRTHWCKTTFPLNLVQNPFQKSLLVHFSCCDLWIVPRRIMDQNSLGFRLGVGGRC